MAKVGSKFIKKALEKIAQDVLMLPKWRIFANSGHTGR